MGAIRLLGRFTQFSFHGTNAHCVYLVLRCECVSIYVGASMPDIYVCVTKYIYHCNDTATCM